MQGQLNNATKSDYSDATAWCAAGFCQRESDGTGRGDAQLRTCLITVLGIEMELLPWWNDAPGRTAAEVAQLFDAAASLLERQEQTTKEPA